MKYIIDLGEVKIKNIETFDQELFTLCEKYGAIVSESEEEYITKVKQ